MTWEPAIFRDTQIEMNLEMYYELFQHGFWGYCTDEDHDEPYLFYFKPRTFEYDEEEKLIIVYYENSDDVYCAFPLRKYGRTWALTKEALAHE